MASDDIQGTITDSSGQAISGATVALWLQNNPNQVTTTTTDTSGNYIFDGHPDGDGTSQNWHLAARDPNDSTRQFRSLHTVSASLPSPGALPDESAIHRWPLGEGSGTTAADSIGAADMALNGVSWTSGTYIGDYAGDGDGTDDYGDVGTLGTFGSNLGSGWSITLTINTTDSGAWCGINNSNDATVFLLGNDGQFGTNGNAYVVLRDLDGNTSARELDSTINDGTDVRIGASVDGPDPANWTFYVNGSEANSSITNDQGTTNNFSDFDSGVAFWARNNAGTIDQNINALIDEPILYDSVLSATEFSDDYDRQPWS